MFLNSIRDHVVILHGLSLWSPMEIEKMKKLSNLLPNRFFQLTFFHTFRRDKRIDDNAKIPIPVVFGE